MESVDMALAPSHIATLLRQPRLIQSVVAEVFDASDKVRLHVRDVQYRNKKTTIVLVGYLQSGYGVGSHIEEPFGVRVTYSKWTLCAANEPLCDFGIDSISKEIRSTFVVDLSQRLFARRFRVASGAMLSSGRNGHIIFVRGKADPTSGRPLGIWLALDWGSCFYRGGYPEPALPAL